MADKKTKSPEQIAEDGATGWTVVKKNLTDLNVDVRTSRDSSMPSVEQLKEKYFGNQVKTDSVSTTQLNDTSTTNVTLESGPLKKSVGVSQGKIIWRQG
jgi:hypothetical protein